MRASWSGRSLHLLPARWEPRPWARLPRVRSSAPSPTPVFSIGQPPIWRQQISAQGTAYTQEGGSGATFSYGVFHSLNKPPVDAFNPLLGIIGGTLEGYGSLGGVGDAGVRAMATSRMLATSVGADWDIAASPRQHHPELAERDPTRRSTRPRLHVARGLDPGARTDRTRRHHRAALPAARRTHSAARADASRFRIRHSRARNRFAVRDAAAQQLAHDIESASNAIAAYSDLYTDDAIRAARSEQLSRRDGPLAYRARAVVRHRAR